MTLDEVRQSLLEQLAAAETQELPTLAQEVRVCLAALDLAESARRAYQVGRTSTMCRALGALDATLRGSP